MKPIFLLGEKAAPCTKSEIMHKVLKTRITSRIMVDDEIIILLESKEVIFADHVFDLFDEFVDLVQMRIVLKL